MPNPNLQAGIAYYADRQEHGPSVFIQQPNGGLHNLPPRLDLVNHAPSGLDWGYFGSGPAQLALAILAHHTGDDRLAKRRYQAFKFDIIGELPYAGFRLTSAQVQEWLDRKPKTESCG